MTNYSSKERFLTKLTSNVIFAIALSIIGISIYSYNFLYLKEYKNIGLKIIFGLLYNLLVLLLLWCMLYSYFVKPPPIPSTFRIDEVLFDNTLNVKSLLIAEVLKLYDLNKLEMLEHETLEPRVCCTCHILKPDRCHHCSICDKCILKFDHHCTFLSTCIGHHNYKAFYLISFYGFLKCFLTIIVGAYPIAQNLKIWPLINSLLAMATIGLCVFFFFACIMLQYYNGGLISKNKSQIEVMFAPTFKYNHQINNPYDLGLLNNFESVFGSNILLWFVPIFTSTTSGYEWSIVISNSSENFNSPKSNEETHILA